MIIVLDTTVVLSDPQLRAAWWKTLKETAKRNGARIMVPEVVVVEAVANQKRNLEALSDKLKTSTQREKRFGVDSICEAIGAAIDTKTVGFERELRGHLSVLGAELVAPPAIDHLELVNRAVSFRKPWDGEERKDGYRDTLNWLTVLSIADRNAGHEVWWISQNSKDFGAGDDEQNPTKWHDHIGAELIERGLSDRVNWAHDVASLLSEIAERTAPVADAEKEKFVAKILVKELFGYVSAELVGFKLDSKQASIEGDMSFAEVRFVTGLEDVEWESLAGDGDGGFVARFTALAGVGIKATILGEDSLRAFQQTRRLGLAGVANLNATASIMAVSITSIESEPTQVEQLLYELSSERRDVGGTTVAVEDSPTRPYGRLASWEIADIVNDPKPMRMSELIDRGIPAEVIMQLREARAERRRMKNEDRSLRDEKAHRTDLYTTGPLDVGGKTVPPLT
ncbi:hypothetical protein CPI83_16970 [Rhodococcus sp. H-CA8f]|uniref:PIN domain-containing protein n=1 Tax=Rhodococcus sp. H-CA8f TaxID=1727214 RepID=UPI000BE31C71|nr:PIN domain-containing protein [Rhodococcus sp. H-CA8f]ATI33553.1 hypothetical protein CPI83_16970 [Rhodococcus sp. H-CA8f]